MVGAGLLIGRNGFYIIIKTKKEPCVKKGDMLHYNTRYKNLVVSIGKTISIIITPLDSIYRYISIN
jgi:hypothetical protein